MDPAELDAIRATASERGMTVSEWVRETLREARRRTSTIHADRKLAAVRAADCFAYPTADIDQMVAEIHLGYGEADE